MKTKPIRLFVPLIMILLTGNVTQSQPSDLFKSGIIEFERTQNIPAAFNYDPAMQHFVEKNGSEIYKSTFTLSLNDNFGLYEYSVKLNGPSNRFDEMPADQNIVFEDFVRGKKIIKKSIFGKTYTLSGDSIPGIKWKLTNERKEIAGYDCRRANGILFDSIYIVGFFSEKFIEQSGPENFRGLPGMILGLSIPGEHIAWFATKVTAEKTMPPLDQPKATNQINYTEFRNLISTRLLSVPKFGHVLYKRALL